jgi:hypothetical protein
VISASVANANNIDDPFPEIKGKFGSKSFGYSARDITVDYGGKVRLNFEDGTLYRRRDSASYDCYFQGEGKLHITDTTELDIVWRNRFGSSNNLKFISAYICGHRLQHLFGLNPTVSHDAKIGRRNWQDLQFLVKSPDRYFYIDLSGELGLWDDLQQFALPVWVELELENGNYIVLYLSPDVHEQLNIYSCNKQFQSPYLLAGFDIGRDLNLSPINIDSSVISIRLKESGKFEARCDIFFPSGTDTRGIKLNLPALSTVDSVFDLNAKELPFKKKKRRPYFYIGPRPEANDQSDRITIYYRGKFMQGHYSGVDLPVNVTNWFPHLPRRTLGRFTIQYTLHKDLALISVGAKINETINGNLKTVTYRTDDISYISFASGVYDTLFDTAQDVPVTLFVRKENNQGLFNRHIPGKVMSDLTEAFESFYDWFGPPLAQNLRIADQPWSTGQSSPGLIHLSQASFHVKRDQARFRAHEIAHQWWGHTAVPKSLRDMWLSEGLSEFTASMYLLNVKADSTAFKDLVERWRKEIMQKGKINGQYSLGYRAGSIAMGTRLLLSYSPGDYYALVYYKAAYMLQMLRFEIDGPSYRTDFFNNMLAEYRREFFDKQASSKDFIRIAQKYIGPRRSESFFQQWLYGWRVPDFECFYSVVNDDKGRPRVNIGIDVFEVDAGFETPFPVQIEFADGSKELFRLDGIGRIGEFTLGPFPQGIKKVRFDPDNIILCGNNKVVEP